MARIAADVTWLVGRTPLVELSRLSPPGTRLLGKLEGWNPSGSNKDRAVVGMIRQAERCGQLRPGGTIVECSSGDLGVAVATIGRRLGYRVVLTMLGEPCATRRRVLERLGAELVVAPTAEGMRGAMAAADRIARQTPGAVCLQAFTNRANVRAQAEMAREIWEDTDGAVAAVVVPIGTGGTAAGCVAFFRDLGVPVIGVQPAKSPVLTGGAPGEHGIVGLGAGFIPDILDPASLAAIVDVTEAEAQAGALALAQSESLLVGPAGGAVLHAAIVHARRAGGDRRPVVAVLPDAGVHHLEDDAKECGR